MTGNFTYTGCDNLEVMTAAVNYNTFLVGTVTGQLTSPDARVLDFGAGSGTYADMLAEHRITPDCLEPDEQLQALLRSKDYRVVDHEAELPANERYDLVYTFNVLEHIKDDQAAARHLASLLRPGGTVVAYVPALEILFTAMDIKVGHYRRYRRTELEGLLRDAGLEIVRSRYCDPLGFFATLAYRAFGSGDGTINPRSLALYDGAVFPLSRALQGLTGKLFGKNVLVVARAV